MRHFHLANSIDQPICKYCGIRMVLARIMPDGVVDVRSFECPKCYRVMIERAPADPLEQSKGGYQVNLNRRDKISDLTIVFTGTLD